MDINQHNYQNVYNHNKQLYMILDRHTCMESHQCGGAGSKKSKSKITNKSISIVDFINNTSIEKIKKDLISVLKNDVMCDKILGQGYVGKVKISGVCDHYTISHKNKSVTIPVAIKESNIDGDLSFFIPPDNQENELFIYSDRNIVAEAIILYYIRQLIEKKLSPHLPYIINHSKCNETTKSPIDRFAIERHGLNEDIIVKMNGFVLDPLIIPDPDYDPNNIIFKTKITSFGDLMKYIRLKKDENNNNNYTDFKVLLPNNIECDIIELIDYFCISYLITYDLLRKHHIHLFDMHADNIFVHWLNKNSYMHDKFIGDMKYIVYNHNKKYYKIKTFGILMKIGDVGASMISHHQSKNNIYIIGHGTNFDKSFNIAKEVIKQNRGHEFLSAIRQTTDAGYIFKKTTASTILSEHPYDKLYWENVPYDLLKDLKTVDQLMKYYDKYTINRSDVKKNNNTLIIS